MAAATAAKLIAKFLEGSRRGSKDLGKLKAQLSGKVREGTATKAEVAALKQLRDKDVAATMTQKAASANTRGKKKPVSLAGSPRVGGTQKKSYGGSMKKKTTMKNKGGKIGRGCGAATKGGGAVMK